ncbi:hypothetical protein [Catellatospora sp. NPDC049133]|jgi:hypothetical protein|uniref:hypothetical protein n=1 Tax=Catellatospora sp. NPDC049133 TaxID=3155499 RepID=UPI0033F9D6B7
MPKLRRHTTRALLALLLALGAAAATAQHSDATAHADTQTTAGDDGGATTQGNIDWP